MGITHAFTHTGRAADYADRAGRRACLLPASRSDAADLQWRPLAPPAAEDLDNVETVNLVTRYPW
jgi:hypothetical protein